MREYRFDPQGQLPVVRSTIIGPKGQKQVTLVFDSGCAETQIHHKVLSLVGCGEDQKIRDVTVAGAYGEGEPAFVVIMPCLRAIGERFEGIEIIGIDFSKWADAGIEGLLGWDLIRSLHFEMNGPQGLLKIF
ncbi:MAG: hypothetical protein DCC75_10475 [Proteobacteria bacterium]|nr:MAG: hypothetical protein DCC75_10475 [Pseudomonadota bacterium]